MQSVSTRAGTERADAARTGDVAAVCEDDVHVLELQPFQTLLCALNNADKKKVSTASMTTPMTHCFRESPPSFGPERRPQNSFVVTTRSVRRSPSSLIAWPLPARSWIL
jgi:hypothetical protein